MKNKYKNNHNHKEWDELERQSLQRQVLAIDESDKTSSSIPLSGSQYIQIVRAEASNVPDVMTCKNIKQLIQAQDTQESLHEMKLWGLLQAKQVEINHLNSVWVNEFTKDFRRLKSHLCIYWDDSLPKSHYPKSESAQPIKLPRDETNWYKALYIDKTLLPTLSTLTHINHPTSLALLKYHIKWLKNHEIRKDQGIWIFALLVKLDPLLTSDQICILRDLSRHCIYIRDHSIPFSMNYAFASVLITIVSGIFGQKDLL